MGRLGAANLSLDRGNSTVKIEPGGECYDQFYGEHGRIEVAERQDREYDRVSSSMFRFMADRKGVRERDS